jgi:hypothetical protein
MRIDETAEHMRTTATMLEVIKAKIKALEEVTSDPSVLSAKPLPAEEHEDEVDEEETLTPEQKQEKDRCIRAFNLNPKLGIELAKQIIGDGPQLTAFLTGSCGLNKTKLGEWLGEDNEENRQVLSEFSYSFHFQGQSLDSAMRMFCSKIKIPSSSIEKIEQIMESFANSYYSMNKGMFSSSDTIHKIAFSCIMLNIDKHELKQKIKSKEAFIANHRGIDGGSDLSTDLLSQLYISITENEITTPIESVSSGTVLFTNPTKSGWMRKQGGRHKGWAKRFFIFSDSTLFYFENEGDIDPKGFFPVENVKAYITTTNHKQITLVPKTGEVMKSAKFNSNGEMVVGNHKTLLLTAGSELEASDWVAILNSPPVSS